METQSEIKGIGKLKLINYGTKNASSSERILENITYCCYELNIIFICSLLCNAYVCFLVGPIAI